MKDLEQMCEHFYKKVNQAKKNEAIAQELIVNDSHNNE